MLNTTQLDQVLAIAKGMLATRKGFYFVMTFSECATVADAIEHALMDIMQYIHMNEVGHEYYVQTKWGDYDVYYSPSLLERFLETCSFDEAIRTMIHYEMLNRTTPRPDPAIPVAGDYWELPF